MPFFPNSVLFWKNNAHNINYMAVLIFSKCLDLRKNAYSRTTSQEAVRECPFSPTLCYFEKIMLTISTIWLCLFFQNALI